MQTTKVVNRKQNKGKDKTPPLPILEYNGKPN